MKTLRWAIATSLVGALFAGTAMAQATMSSPVQQPNSIQQMAFQAEDSNGYAIEGSIPAPPVGPSLPASPSNLPRPGVPGASPRSDLPPVPPSLQPLVPPRLQPPAPPMVKAEETPVAQSPCPEGETPAEEGPYKLFHGCWLDCHHLDIRGYVEAGYTANPDYPLSGFNGPDGYNDRSNQIVLDQLYLIAERVAKVDNDCGLDYGYRADVMYGADAHFVQTTAGTEWDSSWSGGSLYYGLAMPQLYGTLQYNKLTLQGGHFYAPCGYENAMPTENFFYSHTYGFLYGMPTTLTGGLATYKLGDKLSVNAGLDTGWNEFRPLADKIHAMFGVNWTSCDDKINVTSECFVGNMSAAGVEGTRTAVVTDVALKLGCKWRYILENTVAHDTADVVTGMPASWTGFSNYLLYDINDCWGFGIRYEYFEDLDGAVVPGVGLGGFPPGLAPAPIAVLGSKYNDVTIGLNWKPNKNVTMRSEVRWDWAENAGIAGVKPYADGNANGQFLWGNDVVVRF